MSNEQVYINFPDSRPWCQLSEEDQEAIHCSPESEYLNVIGEWTPCDTITTVGMHDIYRAPIKKAFELTPRHLVGWYGMSSHRSIGPITVSTQSKSICISGSGWCCLNSETVEWHWKFSLDPQAPESEWLSIDGVKAYYEVSE